MTYSYHPHARKELDDATDYYDRIDPQLGDDFLKEIDDCISRILRFPRAWTNCAAQLGELEHIDFPIT
ncbi:MAG TPA: type II toxin-antitoxin system RelE/ParE family toxin [Pyrinomonadaceae bacterium]|nr:type II toxin-antitoxin system RelE/ParE family toxin [Pyrinomonadaceae bacterium]